MKCEIARTKQNLQIIGTDKVEESEANGIDTIHCLQQDHKKKKTFPETKE